jgi:hypothetical protein
MLAVVLGVIAASVWGYRLSAAPSSHSSTPPRGTSVALDALQPIAVSRPGASNNNSSVAVLSHSWTMTFGSKSFDHGIMFSLVPGHGGTISESDLTFALAKEYERLSGIVFASGGSRTAPLNIEIQDVSNRSKPPIDLFAGQVQPGGQMSFSAIVRGVASLKISAVTSFDCTCDAAASVLMEGVLAPPPAHSAPRGRS